MLSGGQGFLSWTQVPGLSYAHSTISHVLWVSWENRKNWRYRQQIFVQRGFWASIKVCRETLKEKVEKNNGTTLKRHEENVCTMGREKMHQPGYFKSFTRANVTTVLPQDCRFVASCCYQPPVHAKGKPALCPSVLPLKAWLYSARIWQSGSFFFDASRPRFLGWQRQDSEGRTARHACGANAVSGHTWSPFSSKLGLRAPAVTRLTLSLSISLSRHPREQTRFPKQASGFWWWLIA